ncbi:ABC transporter permease [Streptomyces sp. PTY087I2]|uniref:ABC transporter permease n=1 Tax=Streptomyces sp. PTY087I2 TaxID=1819298 RepID=UPI00080B1C5D|nr:ABC transporter permease [Streptomyces sp. PTY087I2]OCC14047.1 putative D,D-dipeptide transport system permease protein DdpC [Streptomyces sp. PTY087I2]
MIRPILRSLPIAVLGLVVVVALLGPWLPLPSPTQQVGIPFESAGADRPFGTDLLGRDALTRTLHGGRILVLQALVATALGSVVGLAVGTLAGLADRGPLVGLMRMVDTLAAVPPLLVMLLVAAGRPGSDWAVMVAVTAVSLPFSIRVIGGATARLAHLSYVRTALARGDGRLRVIRYDILPNIAREALAEAGIRFIAATQLAATAGFLGLGSPAPAANWGRLVRENLPGATFSPWPALAPAVLLVILALGATLAVDRLTPFRGPARHERSEAQ